MSESVKRIDARGLACPGPVVEAKKALETGGFELLEVLVDGPTAKENVSRFAAYAGHKVEGIVDDDGASTIRIRPSASGSADAAGPVKAAALGTAAAETIFIASNQIGAGSDELGSLLMRGYLKTLIEAPKLPKRIIFMNGGVRLVAEGSDSHESLAKLAELGVEIIACGTCLDYYKLKEKLAVGRVSNMFEISSFLLAGPSLSL
jgi:selenium metabolism protein YedF